MKLLPLILSVARNIPLDRGNSCIKVDAIKRIHNRDKNKCLFCGWHERNDKHRKVTSLTGIYDDNTSSKHLVTSCIICELTQRLVMTGNLGAGDLVYLPELSQAQLNELARAVYFAKLSSIKDCLDAVEPLVSYIRDERRILAAQYIGVSPFNLLNLASALRERDDTTYKKRNEFLNPLRVWPDMKYLSNVIGSDWAYATTSYPPNTWESLSTQISRA
jgi:hypothetical protein